ncbi:hypothetical protein [Streptomyces spiramyceticus]|uniref:hypothetical protein n=1 Tax=Streptomyces spiramyceticus TaxID=299717 RepID=UPI00237B22EA|nr:hypothetical protein [Streptomyces spiramyceticus]
MPHEIQVDDWVPFSDRRGRPIVDMRAVGPGQRHRRLSFADVRPLTVTGRVRIYRDWARAAAAWGRV